MGMNHQGFFCRIACVFALTSFGVSSLDAQVIVNDNFVDGDPQDNGLPGESQFFTTSSSLALENGPQTPGILDFASGTSGRAIHTLFAPQTLVNVGDRLEGSISYIAPPSVGISEDVRFGFFDTSTSPGFSAVDSMGNLVNPNGFAGNISASFGSPEPGLNIAGFLGGADINELGGTGEGSGSGRLLTTIANFSSPTPGSGNTVFSGTDDGTDLPFGLPSVNPAGGSSGEFFFSIELLPNGEVELFQSVFGETLTTTGLVETTANIEDTNGDGFLDGTVFGTGATFDFLGLSVTSGAFGVANADGLNLVGEPDNGLDITNVTVEFIPGVPEPGSAGLLLGVLAGLGLVRRRK